MRKSNEYKFVGIYEYDNYRVEILKEQDCGEEWYNAYLWRDGYGIIEHLYGEAVKNTTLAEFKDLIEFHLDDGNCEIAKYEEDMERFEDACMYEPSAPVDEKLVKIFNRTLKNCEFYEREQNYPALLNEIGCLRGIAYSIEQVAGRACVDEFVDYDKFSAMMTRAEELKKSLDNTSKDEIK